MRRFWLWLPLLLSAAAQAVEVNFTGFASVVAGKVLTGERGAISGNPDYPCPCAAADYPNVGIYDDHLGVEPETLLGLQANIPVNDRLSATLQLVTRAVNDYQTEAEWAYVAYDITPQWTVQAGRKRLPLFYYSDFFDVGYAVPWIRPPADLYGWQIVNYTGANLLYRNTFGDWGVTANVWLGEERDNHNRMLADLYYYGTDVGGDGDNDTISTPILREAWREMIGGYLDLNRDWLQLRLVAMHNVVDRTLIGSADGDRQLWLDGVGQQFLGLAANLDLDNLLIRSEFNVFDRPKPDDRYYARLVGVGYRLGDFTPMLTVSDFREIWPGNAIEKHQTYTASLRWDVSSGVALKAQYDKLNDDSQWAFLGDSELIALGVDVVF